MSAKGIATLIFLGMIGLGLWLVFNTNPMPPGPSPTTTTKPSPNKATAATFVYEKDLHAIPPAVLGALNKLNRELGIIATVFEQDTVDGGGQVPEQYKVALAAAKEVGLPALVVLSGQKVLRVVKDPKTAEQVEEAVK